MKIAVSAKQIPDPAIEPSYKNGILSRPDEQVLDDTDRYGIELALQIKESMGAEVIVVSMGPEGTQKGIQQALQMGPDKAILISDSKLKNANSLTTSKVLADLVNKIEIFSALKKSLFYLPFITQSVEIPYLQKKNLSEVDDEQEQD